LFGLVHNSIKRMLAYSSIANAGYFCLAFAALAQNSSNAIAVESLVAYSVIYVVLSLGAFAVLAWFEEDNREDLLKEELAGVGQRAPFASVCLTIFLLGLAGIPPLAGFFGKYFVFLAAVKAGLYALAIIGVITSVVGAYYYLRVVKIMYFDEPKEAFEPMDGEVKLIAYASGAFTLLFVLPWIASPVIAVAAAAAKSFY
jgi:NADH-quinone oxidoreductase subunit N